MATDKVEKRPRLKSEDFKYLDQLGLPTPQLVLGIEVDSKSFGSDYPPKVYRFKPGRKWLNIVHQTSGHACNQKYLVGTILTPTSAAILGMSRLCETWYDTDTGGFGPVSFIKLLEYRDDLKTFLNVDCIYSYPALEEACYPIDSGFAQQLTTDQLLKNFDDYIDWKDGMERAFGCVNRWGLYVLGPNVD